MGGQWAWVGHGIGESCDGCESTATKASHTLAGTERLVAVEGVRYGLVVMWLGLEHKGFAGRGVHPEREPGLVSARRHPDGRVVHLALGQDRDGL